MTQPLDMRLDHVMTSPVFRTPEVMFACTLAHLRMGDVPNPYQRMRWVRPAMLPRPPKPKQLAGVMLGPDGRRQWQQALAPFKQLDRTGFESHGLFGVNVWSPDHSARQPTMHSVWAAASRGQFIRTWQFAVRRKP